MFYLLRSQLIQRSIFNSIVGVGRANVSLTNLKDLIIPFPPLNEQKRIVFKIEELLTKVDAGIRELKQAKKQLKILRHSVLKFAFEGKFTAEWRNVNKHDIESASELLERVKEKKKKITKNYKELSVEISKYDLPEEWELTNFESIIEDKLIGFVKAMKYQNNQGIGIPYVKMNNITIEGKLDLDDIVYVEANKEEIKKYTLNKGDILFNTRNSYELVGKTAIVTDDNHLRIFNNNIMRIRPFKDINPFFISYQLNSDHFKDYIMHEKKATTNICALYSKDIMPAPIIIPPFEEQEKIVEEIETQFSKIDKTEKNIDITLIQAQRLRKSVLIKAFEGELVPQDHTDESAKKILEHIKEQK